MTEDTLVFNQLKSFLNFGPDDATRLRQIAPLFELHGPTITDGFYAKLESIPETAKMIEGRVDTLKRTHARWMSELFAGEYDEPYYTGRYRIGLVHARVGVAPRWCEAIISFMRQRSLGILVREFAEPSKFTAYYRSMLKVLDLDLIIINLAYEEERLERLSGFTGMSRKLLERCIAKGR